MTHQDSDSAILTPDQRLRVFVSSTLAELADERRAVARAITSLRLSPVMFELGARPHPPQELYRAYLEQSDIFIGLYWQSYGWVGPGMDISGLEDEFRLSGTRPRLLYLKAPAPDRQPLLRAMIVDIEAQGTDAYRTFRTSRELGRLVRDDLALLLSERFAATAHRSRVPSVSGSASAGPTDPAKRPSMPSTSTSLIGREADIVAVAGMLADGNTRLVTLTGPGGMGKTRLAIAVGQAVSRESGTSVLFVPLVTISEPRLVLPRIADAADVILEGTRQPLDALAEHFADQRTLLILDNLEQVVAVAPSLDELLTRCADLMILATSRTVLRLRAEREYVVAPLTVPTEATDLSVEQIAMLPAVRLFVDRARAVRREFTLTTTNAVAVMAICRRLDGLPLAIELAAARTRLLDPATLLATLETVLDVLGSGPVDLPERQRTLRATVEWSTDLLDRPERELLATLSVFAGGWTIEAAAAVAALSEDRTLDLLDSLAGHSLVDVDAAATAPPFRMLTSVREFAAELLVSHFDQGVTDRRHAEYFASLIADDDPPAERQNAWADRLRVDEENVRLAIRWFFEHEIVVLPHLLRALWLFWQVHDRMLEGRTWIDELQRRIDPLALDDTSRAEILFTAAVTAVEVGDDSSALAAIVDMQPLLGLVGDTALGSALQLAVAWTLPISDDFEGALAAATIAYTGFRRSHDPFVAFGALTMGMLNATFGRYDLARQFLGEVEALGSRNGNTWLISSARTQLASLSVRIGALETAATTLAQVLDTIDDARVGTLTACFTLGAFAELSASWSRPREAAVAVGAVAGLRHRAGLLAWPLTRRAEADLAAELTHQMDPEALRAAHADGERLHVREALALVRSGLTTPHDAG